MGQRSGFSIVPALFSFLFILCVVIAVGATYAVHCYEFDGPLKEEKVVFIKKGMSVSRITEQLKKENILSCGFFFKLVLKLQDKGGSLKAGEYVFKPGISMKELIVKLEKGDVLDRSIMIPQGLTSFEIVKLLEKEEALSGDIESRPQEGSLLPETYHFTKGESRTVKIRQMQKAMTDALEEIWQNRQEGLPVKTKEEAVILASIVEKETGVASERKRVAGVFINRLRKGMKLQSDPTVIYALIKGEPKNEGKGPLGRRLLRKDLSFDSPYNTYLYEGLPPGPIANPGRPALEAVLNPEEHNYLYFVADGSGGHVFASSLREHNNNAAKWRKIRKKR